MEVTQETFGTTIEVTYRDAFVDGLRPDPLLTVDEWADAHRYLSQVASAEPGRWRTSRTPYLREVMRALSPHDPCKEIVFMKGAQIGATEAGNNWIGYVIDAVPGPMLAVQPTVELAKRYSRQRIETLIEESPRLKGKVADPKARDSGNTMLSKDFRGGQLVMTGANSAVGLRSMAARYLFLDEVDAYPDDADGEGDPIELAAARTRTFARRKIFTVSTPTLEGRSKIEAAFALSSMEHYFVPCPFCDASQTIEWERIRYEGKKPKEAFLECEGCSKLIPEHYKTRMLEAGSWVASNAEETTVRGFFLSSLYSPIGWYSWADAARDYERVRDNPEKLRTWTNTVLGRTWRERGDAPNWNRLYERRETYAFRTVPKGGLILTAGVDVQKDRLEVEVTAWGRDKQSWSIDYVVIPGDTATDAPWDELSRVLDAQYPHEHAGVMMGIRMMGVDSGYNTQHVYSWVKKQSPSRVAAMKGQDGLQMIVGQPRAVDINMKGKKVTTGIKVWPIGVSVAKMELYGWLRKDSPVDGKPYPSGFCHFPQFGPEYFQMLTAEELESKVVRGYRHYEWKKIRERNEALDCRVYSRAAAAMAGIDRWQDETWNRMEESLGIGVPEVRVAATPQAEAVRVQATTLAPTVIPRKRGSYW